MASYYSDEIISEIVSANDIVDIASSYMKLTRNGNGYKGLCPFHGEKTPSFHISPDKQLYHCFGCGAGGSVIQFIMTIENLDFVETVKLLADRAKIILPDGDETGNDSEFYHKKQALYKLNAVAAKFFYTNLVSPIGAVAQEYILKRGFDSKTVTSFGLGYAADSFSQCTEYLLANGFDEQTIIDGGLARRSEKNGKLFDFYRNRIIFPIIDIRGNVIAFGARVLDGSLPKYLNSPDTVVFNKSKTLFALNFAKRTCHEKLILCEGYMDVIALHKAGFTNAVATLGTALTREHAKIISRYTSEVILCYDSDGAGQKATALAMEILKDTGVRTRVLTLSGAKDPDEFIKNKGSFAFGQILSSSENAVLYKIGKLKEQYNINDIDDKILLINKMAEVFADIDNAIEQEVLIKDTANELGISPESISAQINLIKQKRIAKQNSAFSSANRISLGKSGKRDNVMQNRECLLVSLIANDSRVYNELKDKVTPEFFTLPSCVSCMTEINKFKSKGINVDTAILVSSLNPLYAKELVEIITSEKPYENPVRAALDIYESILDGRFKSSSNLSSAEELNSFIELLKKHKN